MIDFDIDFDLDEFESSDVEEEDTGVKKFLSISEDTIIPREGAFLGLDISQNSSGICLYKDGKKYVYNSSVSYDITNPHAEAFIRKQLKDDLLEVINGVELDLVVIEDVFEGSNADIVRRLYALNTAIDDLILDGKVICKKFVRVANGTWKNWLSVVDAEGVCKGLNDKQRVQMYLATLGVYEEGEGFQDRLDATGMLLGYFLKGKEDEPEKKLKQKSLNININDIDFGFEVDSDLIQMAAAYEREECNTIFINESKITKKKILEYMSEDISAIFITREPIRLGLLADTLGLDLLEEGGYFGFWLSDKAQKKYKKRLERLKS